MEENFSAELKSIMDAIGKYIDNNPTSKIIVSFRDLENDIDNLIMYQIKDNGELEETIDTIEDVIKENMVIESGEPYGKFFHFAEFTNSFN